ncbi:DNA-protecting protein DprA [Beijerinckiaceae bacterium]|nr:DNA-protecting protein DprA [Beijerinckiaceae bacterium]
MPLPTGQLVELNDAERFDWLRLVRSENIGPRTFQLLLSRYGSAGAALSALPDLIARGQAGRPIRIATLEDVDRELDAVRRQGARFFGLWEPDYPALLRQIAGAPPLIAARGNFASLRRSMIAVVGSRNASAAGLAFTSQLVRGVARAGHVIVSGLARGIDARAHQAAMETGTIAVLAGGLGNIYPAEHEALLERLLEEGAAVSEMPFGWEARGRDFPRRNRIVAGLCRATIVVEAARRSGSLITARFAAEQGREIFAVPGSPLDPRAEGANDLLRDGATFCTKAEDVIEALAEQDLAREQASFGFSEPDVGAEPQEPLWDELDLAEVAGAPSATARIEPNMGATACVDPQSTGENPSLRRPAVVPHDDLVARVFELLGPVPISVDEIVRMSEASAKEVRTILLGLKLAGTIEWHGGDLVSFLPET